MKRTITLTVNGAERQVEVQDNWLLSDVLREQLGLHGVREGCGTAVCGSCTVLLDGRPVTSCLVLAPEVQGRQVTTVEGLAQRGRLHPVQRAFVEAGGLQCGICTPGMIVSAAALLDRNPEPSEAEIRYAIAGNLCRCTGYDKIVRAVEQAAEIMRESTQTADARR